MLRTLSLALAGLAITAPVSAHHGFGSFDLRSTIELTGTVTDLDWVNPHAWLYLEVTRENGAVAAYRCEMRAATVLRRSGWSPDMFTVGEQVTISGSPDREDSNSCYVSTVIFADGSSIDRYGQRTEPTPVQDPAEREPRHANGEPNITGDWAPEQFVMTDPRGQSGALVPLSVARELAEGGAEGRERSRGPSWGAAEVEMTALGEQAAEGFEMWSTDNPRMRCETTSILFDWNFDGPVNRITQHEDRIVLQYGQYGFTRTVHMNMDAHPENVEPSRAGHSIGRWEGDTLVVDTVGFAPGMLAPPVFHGEKLHVVERFTVDTGSWTLTREYEATDPDYFTNTYVGADMMQIADVPYAPDDCKELTFVDYGEDAGAAAAAAGEAASAPAESAAPDDDSPWWVFWD